MDRNEIPFDLQSGIYLYPWKHLLHWRTKSKNTRHFFIVKSHMKALKRLLCVTVQNPAITMMNSVNLEIFIEFDQSYVQLTEHLVEDGSKK